MARSRYTYAIGDIHGRDDLFEQMLRHIDLHADGKAYRLVLLGDLVDRGPDSAGVLRRARTLAEAKPASVVVLRGNHEDMMARACAPGARIDAVACWIANGGGATLASFGVKDPRHLPPDMVQWVSTLPTCWSDALRVFVHAGLDPASTWDDQSDTDRMWIRGPFLEADHDFGRHVVHGHTPMLPDAPGGESFPDERPFRTNVDTGAVFGGPLTAAVFDHTDPRPLAFLQVASGSEPVVLGARRTLQAWLGLDDPLDAAATPSAIVRPVRPGRLREWGRPLVAASLAVLIAGGSTGWGSSGRHETPVAPAPSGTGPDTLALAGPSPAEPAPSPAAAVAPQGPVDQDTAKSVTPPTPVEQKTQVARAPSEVPPDLLATARPDPLRRDADASPKVDATPPLPAADQDRDTSGRAVPLAAAKPSAPAASVAAVSAVQAPAAAAPRSSEPSATPMADRPKPPGVKPETRLAVPAQPQDVFVAQPPADLVPGPVAALPPAAVVAAPGPKPPAPTALEASVAAQPPVDPGLIIAGLTAGLPVVDLPWFPPAEPEVDVEARIREQTQTIPEPAPAAEVLATLLPARAPDEAEASRLTDAETAPPATTQAAVPTTAPDAPRAPVAVPLPPRPDRGEKPATAARAPATVGPALRAKAAPAVVQRPRVRTARPAAAQPSPVAAIPPPLCRDGRPPSGFQPGVGWICTRTAFRGPAGGVFGFFGEGPDRTGSIAEAATGIDSSAGVASAGTSGPSAAASSGGQGSTGGSTAGGGATSGGSAGGAAGGAGGNGGGSAGGGAGGGGTDGGGTGGGAGSGGGGAAGGGSGGSAGGGLGGSVGGGLGGSVGGGLGGSVGGGLGGSVGGGVDVGGGGSGAPGGNGNGNGGGNGTGGGNGGDSGGNGNGNGGGNDR